MKRTEYEIEIRQALLPREKEFIAECITKKDFQMFIGTISESLLYDAYLFYYGEEILGVFWPQISNKTGVTIAMPSIYMKKRLSRFTVICIGKMLSELFSSFHVDKVLTPVYSNNKSVLNGMKNYNLFLEGIFSRGLIINDEPVDIYYYSILPDELENMKSTYREVYGI